jgi:hypothetical protein
MLAFCFTKAAAAQIRRIRQVKKIGPRQTTVAVRTARQS